MKNLKILALLIVIVFSSVSFTIKENPDLTKQLHDQIVKLLGKTTNMDLAEDTEAKVVFMLNNKKEIVVISVISENENIDRFVKAKLNYKKVKVNAIDQTEIYKLPLILKKRYH